jgi:leader peptidase (prepilin peptidase)/N-methyltransferase
VFCENDRGVRGGRFRCRCRRPASSARRRGRRSGGPVRGVSALLWGVVAWRCQSGDWPRWWVPVPLAGDQPRGAARAGRSSTSAAAECVGVRRAYPVLAAAIGVADGYGGEPLVLWAGLCALAFRRGARAPGEPSVPWLGDVKPAGSVGAVLGSVGWAALVVGAGLAAVVTTALAIVSAASARLRRERFTRWQSGVPHGPGLLIATWLVGSVPRNRGGGGHERMTRSRHVGGLFRAGERTVEGSAGCCAG